MRPFVDLSDQPVQAVDRTKHHIGAVHSQVVEVRGCRVICGAQGAELKVTTCPVYKGVELM